MKYKNERDIIYYIYIKWGDVLFVGLVGEVDKFGYILLPTINILHFHAFRVGK